MSSVSVAPAPFPHGRTLMCANRVGFGPPCTPSHLLAPHAFFCVWAALVMFADSCSLLDQVFWWCLAGKFGKRMDALAPQLAAVVAAAAEVCNDAGRIVNPCRAADWSIDSPGDGLTMGIAAVRSGSASSHF